MLRPIRATVLSLLLACCLVSLAAGVASASTTLVLTEVTTSFVLSDVPPAGPSAGDSFRFTADLLVGENQVGTSVGRSVTTGRQAGGDVVGFIVERLELDDGAILAFGQYNQTGLQQRGEPATITAIGLSGAYRGLRGTLTAQPIRQGLETLTIDLH